MVCGSPLAVVAVALAAAAAAALSGAADAQTALEPPVAAAPHFTFHSDFATNLNDALIAAGNARRAGQPELFQSGEEQRCFQALPPRERAAWDRAVDYYAEIVSPASPFARPRTLIRLGLLFGGSEWAMGEERRFIELAALFREAASVAYGQCRWPAQDAANRRWIDDAMALLRTHAEAVAARLQELYGASWTDLPLRVDVVDTVSAEGADSLFVQPPPHHILINSGTPAYRGTAALEMLFHEASHFLTGPRSPLRRSLGTAENDRLWHVVLFYVTGETVRRALADTGESRYVPFMHAQDLFGGELREAVSSAFDPYLDGRGTLEEAAAELLRALER